MTPRIVGFRVAWVALVGLWWGFGVALVEPWCGFGGALVGLWWSFGVALWWLWTPEYMPSICLLYGFAVALGGLSVQGLRPSTLGHRPLQTLRFSVARREVGLLGCFRWNRDSSPQG